MLNKYFRDSLITIQQIDLQYTFNKYSTANLNWSIQDTDIDDAKINNIVQQLYGVLVFMPKLDSINLLGVNTSFNNKFYQALNKYYLENSANS